MYSLQLRIKKRPFPAWMILWIVVLPFLWGTFFDLLHLPSILKYTADVAWVILLGFLLVCLKVRIDRRLLNIVLLVTVFFIYCLILYFLNYQSPFYFLWGFRNNFRYYVLFFSFTMFLTADDAERIYNVMDILFWVNAAVIFIQYFALGYKQDNLGGLFGIVPGCNAMNIIFLFIVLGRSLLKYMERREAFWLCFVKCAVSLAVAAFAEMKFFFVVFVLLLGMSMLITSFSWRKLIICTIGIILVMAGSALLTSLFDFENFMSLENIWNLATQEHYSSQETVNRLSALPTLARTVITDPLDRLFGLGLGNCDTSAFAICNTPFFATFGHLRYTYFSCAILFLEVGYLGLILYLAFFVLCFIEYRKIIKQDGESSVNVKLAVMMTVLALLLVFYNNSLRIEIGYLVYLVLAVPFIGKKKTDALINEAEEVGQR